MVLSNTCDIAPENKRLLGPRLLYCPIISFGKYANLVSTHKGQPDPKQHLEDIRMQRISEMFYLPRNEQLGEDGIALLARINNCDAQRVSLQELARDRLFTLSDYGFYFFLFKLSIHLTRIRENVARS
jgi:hypothetical protein